MDDLILQHVLADLRVLVLEPAGDGAFAVRGTPPPWLVALSGESSATFRPGELFPFLEDFLAQAREQWDRHDAGRLKSGFWAEADAAGETYQLEATAMELLGRPVLVIQRVDAETISLFQAARTSRLRSDHDLGGGGSSSGG